MGNLAKLLSKIQLLVVKVYKILYQSVYILFSFFWKIDEKNILIILSRENKLQGNLQFVFFELEKNYPDMTVNIIQTKNKMNLKLFKELIYICKSKYIILDDYYLPIYILKLNKELKVIQLWHAAGAFKKFGYSTIGTNFGPSESYLKIIPIHSNYTHVYVSSTNVVDHYAEAFNMSPENIYPIGIPRIDAFNNTKYINSTKKEIYIKHPCLQARNKINILVAPTYRASGSHKESSFSISEVFTNESFKIKSHIQIIFKPHPYIEKSELDLLKKVPNIYVVNDFSINDLMLIADAFITDYSSAIFDFSLLKRPFAHYVQDLEEYQKNRGFYEDLSEISVGHIITDMESLINWINDRKKGEYFETMTMISKNFDNTIDVSEKIVKHFLRK